MKKLLITMSIALFGIVAFAQESENTTGKSMYNIGDEITSCESNFHNLFNNWTKNQIANADQTKLLSYKFIEAVKDEQQVDHYINLLTSLDAPQRKLSMNNTTNADDATTKKIIFNIKTYKDLYENSGSSKTEQFLSTLKSETDKVRKLLKEKHYIEVGDKIFLIKIKSGNKIYDNYVVCDADNFKVKWDNLFNFPL